MTTPAVPKVYDSYAELDAQACIGLPLQYHLKHIIRTFIAHSNGKFS